MVLLLCDPLTWYNEREGEIGFSLSKILGTNSVSSPCNKLLGLLQHPWIWEGLWIKDWGAGVVLWLLGDSCAAVKQPPTCCTLNVSPCLLRGLLLAEQGTFLCSWAVRSSRHPAVPGGKREAEEEETEKEETEKEETEEGRQDYGFKNRRICGLIL